MTGKKHKIDDIESWEISECDERERILGTSKSDSIDGKIRPSEKGRLINPESTQTDEMPKVFLVKGRTTEDVEWLRKICDVEITPEDLKSIIDLIKYCFNYSIISVDYRDGTGQHFENLLKKLESLTS